ncbi:hypothetical protein FKP32DRAFT_1684193 [Trametes sanguinea]|nr:hypothetical protein FKP32DRAFT_1684193 [Trametes sanguinea]
MDSAAPQPKPKPVLLLDELRKTLSATPPFCSGTLQLPASDLELYYGRAVPRFIDFTTVAQRDGELDMLEKACEAAVFGKGSETVLDETYRKAGKMDPEQFMTRFSVELTGLLDVVRQGLLTGAQEKKTVEAELYKLNLYGKGAFFKPHLDTPRSDKMFGTLIAVFPTPHEGGELLLRHDGKEWTFDSARLLAGHTDRIAFVAFFSDVEHEVFPVRAGHRVNLTYNLSFADASLPPKRIPPPDRLHVLQPIHFDPAVVREALRNLLSDADVLPSGGTFAFALRHIYPIPRMANPWAVKQKRRKSDHDADVEDLIRSVQERLKGCDATLYEACQALGLQPRLRFFMDDLYEAEDKFLFDDISVLSDTPHDGCPYGIFETEKGVTYVRDGTLGEDDEDDAARKRSPWRPEAHPVYWVTPRNDLNEARWPFVGYGNQASLSYEYISVCLTVDAPPFSERVKAFTESMGASPGEIKLGEGGSGAAEEATASESA